MQIKKIKTSMGEVTKYIFSSYADLEDYFINNLIQFETNKLKTKVIGLTLLTFKQPKKGKINAINMQ